MASDSRFDDFLNRQNNKARTHGNVDERKNAWLTKIDELYDDVERLLGSYLATGRFTLSRESVSLHEDLLGNYQAPALTLNFGYSNAEFRPVGTFLIGSPGRVDLKGGRGTVRFILVPADLDKPSVTVRSVSVNDSPARRTSVRDEAPNVDAFVWKISTNPPNIRYSGITEKSLTEAIMAVANG